MVASVLRTHNDQLYYDYDYKIVSVGLAVGVVHTHSPFANDREHQIRLDPNMPGWWLLFGPTPVFFLASDCLRGRAFMYCIAGLCPLTAGSNANRCFNSVLLTGIF